MTVKAVWHIVKESAKRIGVPKLAPHDLRRTCARLCHTSGGELDQIQFLLGHVSVQTTERYLGCKQRIRSAVNDRIASSRILEPSARLWKVSRQIGNKRGVHRQMIGMARAVTIAVAIMDIRRTPVGG